MVKELLNKEDSIDVILTRNDMLANGAVKAFEERQDGTVDTIKHILKSKRIWSTKPNQSY